MPQGLRLPKEWSTPDDLIATNLGAQRAAQRDAIVAFKRKVDRFMDDGFDGHGLPDFTVPATWPSSRPAVLETPWPSMEYPSQLPSEDGRASRASATVTAFVQGSRQAAEELTTFVAHEECPIPTGVSCEGKPVPAHEASAPAQPQIAQLSDRVVIPIQPIVESSEEKKSLPVWKPLFEGGEDPDDEDDGYLSFDPRSSRGYLALTGQE
jgi:hypothetical protein